MNILGPVPFLVGSLVGGGLIGGMTLIVNNLNKRGTVAFEMKFWFFSILSKNQYKKKKKTLFFFIYKKIIVLNLYRYIITIFFYL